MALKRIGLGLVVGASRGVQLSALKELLKHEPVAAEEKDADGSVWYVYPDRIVPGEETDAPGGRARGRVQPAVSAPAPGLLERRVLARATAPGVASVRVVVRLFRDKLRRLLTRQC